MKRVLSVLIAAVLLLGLFGCSAKKNMLADELETVTDSSIFMSYSLFNGSRAYTFHLTEEKPVSVEIKTGSGKLHLDIAQEGCEPIYSGNITEDFSFRLNAEPGFYQIRLTADSHSGSFGFLW